MCFYMDMVVLGAGWLDSRWGVQGFGGCKVSRVGRPWLEARIGA